MTSATPKRQRRKEARPSEIMAAALTLFSERGFAATRLDDVAEAAGVSKATIYLYFENKEQLFTALVHDIATPRFDEIERMIDTYQGSSADMLSFVIARLGEIATTTRLPALAKIVLAESGNFPEIRAFYRDQIIRRGFGNLERIIERGIERGEFRRCNVKAAVQDIVFPILMNALARNTFGELPQFDPDGFLAAHAEFVLRGLAADREA
ncbi:MAG: TetR/AcrR family transcriptional regulator [Parvibaculum sp.]|uniref:TetR/AcrR family transcriptional regulator n=1 Tax=Parvibaculum sp. TaxID=2024848 RepID=UPI00349FFE3D